MYFSQIDEDVMKICRQHLRSACGSALDSYVGPNHRVRIAENIETSLRI